MNTKEKNTVNNLITLYKERPELWNSNLKSYRDKYLKSKSYLDISRRIGFPVDVIKKKINNLRSQFLHEEKKILRSKRSGTHIYTPTWCYYEQMKFIKESASSDDNPNLFSNETEDPPSDNQDENDRLSSIDDHNVGTPTTPNRRKSKRIENDVGCSEEKLASVTLEKILASETEKEQFLSTPIIHHVSCETQEEFDRLCFVGENNPDIPNTTARAKRKRNEEDSGHFMFDEKTLRSATKEDQVFAAYVLSLLSLSKDLSVKLQLHREILNLIHERLFPSV